MKNMKDLGSVRAATSENVHHGTFAQSKQARPLETPFYVRGGWGGAGGGGKLVTSCLISCTPTPI